MNKKAQGISLNVIIIAAVALIVLVILVAIFTGRMGIFTKDIGTATEGAKCSGKVMTPGECDAAKGEQLLGNFNDVDAGLVCCKTAETTEGE